MATALPVIATADNTLPLTAKVATPIVPTETAGSLVDSLLDQRDVDVVPEVKTIIKFDAMNKARVVTLPAGAAGAAVLDVAAQLIVTLTRDDSTGTDASTHTQAATGGADPEGITASVFDEDFGITAMTKQSRTLAALINAIADRAKKLGKDLSGYVLVHDTTGDGSLKVYSGTFGTLAGKVADVTQTAAPASIARPSRW